MDDSHQASMGDHSHAHLRSHPQILDLQSFAVHDSPTYTHRLLHPALDRWSDRLPAYHRCLSLAPSHQMGGMDRSTLTGLLLHLWRNTAVGHTDAY